jgi:arginyl-tRNA--protein-N-Asp/Glu arginylyltransferase
MVQDSFELIKDYCKATNQSGQMKAAAWYHFARLLRDALVHNQCWEFKNYDRAILPITWRGQTITISMENHAVSTSFFGWFDGCVLFQDFYAFASSLH